MSLKNQNLIGGLVLINRYELSYNTYLKIGARFSSLGYKGPNTEPLPELITNNNVTIHIDRNIRIGYSNDFWFLELPVSFGFFDTKNKISYYAEAGLSPNIFLATRKKLTKTTNSFRRYTDDRSISAAVIVGIGLAYQLNEKAAIFTQPSFRYHFTTLAPESSAIKEFLYSYGIEFGFRKILARKEKEQI